MILKQIIRPLQLLILTSVAVVSASAERKEIRINQADPRFSLTVQRGGLSLGSESYWFYVSNNTSDEYEMVVSIDLDLACVGEKSFVLGVNKIVRLKPGGRFTPETDWAHTYNVTDSKGCRLTDGDGFTLFKGLRYQFNSIKKITRENNNSDEDKNKEGTKKLNQSQNGFEKKTGITFPAPLVNRTVEAPASQPKEESQFGRARLGVDKHTVK